MEDSDPLIASSGHRIPAQNSQREGRGPLFQWDAGISVGLSTENTGSIRNPETRRTPSYGLAYLQTYSIDQ